ncbi:MAG: hypothetical protein AAF483_18155 [Planctomycetota bacterium]
MLRQQLLSFLVLSILLGFTGSRSAIAQSQVLIRISPDDDGSKQFEGALDGLKESSTFYMQRLIADYKRSCDLDDVQAERLHAAAKGAVVKFVESQRKEHSPRLKQYQKIAGFDAAAKRNLSFYLQIAHAQEVRCGGGVERRLPPP